MAASCTTMGRYGSEYSDMNLNKVQTWQLFNMYYYTSLFWFTCDSLLILLDPQSPRNRRRSLEI
jgi:hypothetical protein